MKYCRGCNTSQPLENFSRAKKYKDGRQTKCKECCKKYGAAWRKKNPVSKGGSHTLANFQTLCVAHNSIKGVRIIDYRSSKLLALL